MENAARQGDFQRGPRAAPLRLAAGNRRVPMVGELLDQLPQFVVDDGQRQRDGVYVVCRNGGDQNADEIADFLEPNPDPVDHVGSLTVADGIQIGHQVALILRREAKIEPAVEIADDLVVAVEAPIVEIGRVEISIEERRRLE